LLLAATLLCRLIVPPCGLSCGVSGLSNGSARGSARGASCLAGRLPRAVLRSSPAFLFVLLASTGETAHEALRLLRYLLRSVLRPLHRLSSRLAHGVLHAPFGFPILLLDPPLLALLRGPAGGPLLRPSGHARHVFGRDAPVGARAFGSGEVYAHLLGLPPGRRRGVRLLSFGLFLVLPLAPVALPGGLSAGVLPSRRGLSGRLSRGTSILSGTPSRSVLCLLGGSSGAVVPRLTRRSSGGILGLVRRLSVGVLRSLSSPVGRLSRGLLRSFLVLSIVLLVSTCKTTYNALRLIGHPSCGVLHLLGGPPRGVLRPLHGLAGGLPHGVPDSSFGFLTVFLGPLFLTLPLVPAGDPLLRSFSRARHVLDGDASTGA